MEIKEKIKNIIFDAIDEINEQRLFSGQINKSEDLILIGKDAALDSLGLVHLVASVEERIEEEFSKTIILVNEKAMSQEITPFKTVKTLTDYMAMLLEQDASE